MSDIASILFRRKLLILGVFAATLAVTFAVILRMPKKYESRMKVFIKNERADSVVSPDDTNAVIRGEVSESDVNSEIELLTNSALLARVVVRTGLHGRQTGSGGPATEEMIERAARALARNLVVTPVRKASIIQVVYSSQNAEEAATVLSTLAELYLKDHLRVHHTAGAQDFFRTQAEEYGQRLSDVQDRLSEFRRRNNVVLLGEQKDLMLRRVMDAEQAVTETDAGLSEATGRISTLKRQLAALQPRVVTQSRTLPNQYSVERLLTMQVELENRRTSLLTRFQPDDRLVVELDKQIEQTGAALARARTLTSVEQTSDANPLRQKLEMELADAELKLAGLQSRRSSLGAALAVSRSRLASLDSVTAEHDGLSREIKQAEDNLVLYSKKKEEARIADSLDEQKIANVSIAEPPTRPYLPSKPNVPLNLAVGFLFACFAGLGSAFVAELTRSTFDSPGEIQSSLKLPVLASVPVEVR